MKLSDISFAQEGLLLDLYTGKFKPGDEVFVLEPQNPNDHEGGELDTVRRGTIVIGNMHGGYPEYVRTGDEDQTPSVRASRNPVAIFTAEEAAQAVREDPRIAMMLGGSALSFDVETFNRIRTDKGSSAQLVHALSDIVTRRCTAVTAV